jgi:hypothetical protein
MAANEISTLATKELRQKAKLTLASSNRTVTNRGDIFDKTLLPTQYVGNIVFNNSNTSGLQLGRPWRQDFTYSSYLFSTDLPLYIVDVQNNVFLSQTGITFFDCISLTMTSPTVVRLVDGNLGWSAHNLITRSEDLDHANWTKSSNGTGSIPVVTANEAVAPDGSKTAEKVFFDAGAGTTSDDSSTISRSFTTLNGPDYTSGIWALGAVGGEEILIRGVGADTYTKMTLTTEWKKFEVEETSVGTSQSLNFTIRQSVSGFGVINATATVYLWGAHNFRSDLGGMQDNPDSTDRYVPTPSGVVYKRAINYDTSNVREGVIIEPARTNLLTHSDDLTNAVYTKTNVTATKDQTGPDGVSNSATRLTADAGNGTCLATGIISASATHVYEAHVKRITGSGTINITLDNGVTWEDITSEINSSIYTQVAAASQTIANPDVGFRIVTSGDEIAVQFSQCAVGAFIGSPIPTAGFTVTRDVVIAQIPKAYVGTDAQLTEGTWFMKVKGLNINSDDRVLAGDGSSSLVGVLSNGVKNYDGGNPSLDNTVGGAIDSPVKIAVSFKIGTGRSITYEGVNAVTDANDYLVISSPADFYILQRSNQNRMPGGVLQHLVFIPKRESDATIKTITDAATVYPRDYQWLPAEAMQNFQRELEELIEVFWAQNY